MPRAAPVCASSAAGAGSLFTSVEPYTLGSPGFCGLGTVKSGRTWSLLESSAGEVIAPSLFKYQTNSGQLRGQRVLLEAIPPLVASWA